MTNLAPLPSQRLRLLAALARWALRLVLALWVVVLLVWGGLHFFIVPAIPQWGERLQAWASQAIGAPVRIGRIHAQAQGLYPTITLHEVAVLDADNRPALQLPKVVLTISPRSVLRGGLEQLLIEAPHLDIHRHSDGRWRIAGLELTGEANDHNTPSHLPALQWLLEQPELALQSGSLHFVDALRDQALRLQQVNVVLRGNAWRHAARLDAQDDQGQALHAAGLFRRPLLPGSTPIWQRWSGQWFAQLQLQQLPRIDWPAAWGITQAQGSGQVRLWADVHQGHIVGSTADMALPQVHLQWQEAPLPALTLANLQGRLSAQWQDQTWAVQAQQLGFTWQPQGQAAQHWPASNWSVEATPGAHAPNVPDALPHLRATVEQADLGLLSSLLTQLPLAPALRQPLARWQPQGQLSQLQLRWNADNNQPNYQASGHIQGLHLHGQAVANGPGIPGVQGVDVEFTATQDGGQARLHTRQGVLQFPGVFEEPDIPLDALDARLQWTRQHTAWKLDIAQATFANADAQGQFTAHWQTGDSDENYLPGILDLRGRLHRADGTQVHRYLPLEIPQEARHYVRDSVRAGGSQAVDFEVRGDLRHMPFDQPGTGRFYIAAPVQDVVYDYVPATLRPHNQAPWPVLEKLSGLLEFEGAGMRVRAASTGISAAPGLQMHHIEADIADFSAPVVQVRAQGQGNLAAMLQAVRGSAIEQLTQSALTQAQAHGPAQLALQLQLPLENLDNTRVSGQVQLQGNQLTFTPSTPRLEQLQGRITFHEQGFALHQVQGQTLGGAVTLSGGMDSPQQGVLIQAQGQASAQGLAAQAPLALVRQLAQHAQGHSAYSVQVRSQGAAPEVLVRSDLHGLALDLPAPLDKSANTTLPLVVRYTPQADEQAQLDVLLHERARLRYQIDTDTEQARSGFITLGSNDLPSAIPQASVTAQVRLPWLDMDAWAALVPSSAEDAATDSQAAATYLPQRLVLDVENLRLYQRNLGPSSAQLSQRQGRWWGQLQAQQFVGYVEYRPPNPQHPQGLVFARLEHLRLPKADTADDADGAEEGDPLAKAHAATPDPQEDNTNWPALDIHVQDLEVADKPLGQLFLLARPHPNTPGRNWTLERFELRNPAARWKAQGEWAAPSPQQRRRTALTFELQMQDAGAMLARLGMPGVLQDGSGLLQGQMRWQGSPIAPHWPSMQGQVHLDMGKGQFLKVEPGMGKLLSVLSLQSISRRLSLDFRDVFSAGFAFDLVRGDVDVAHGIAHTNNLQMKGLNAAVLMEGQANLQAETQQLRLVVVPEINAMTASLVATAINPVVGLGSFIAQALLRGPAMAAATRSFDVSGTWADPIVTPAKDSPPADVNPE